jgi:hypothetical protein
LLRFYRRLLITLFLNCYVVLYGNILLRNALRNFLAQYFFIQRWRFLRENFFHHAFLYMCSAWSQFFYNNWGLGIFWHLFNRLWWVLNIQGVPIIICLEIFLNIYFRIIFDHDERLSFYNIWNWSWCKVSKFQGSIIGGIFQVIVSFQIFSYRLWALYFNERLVILAFQ